MWCMCFKWVGYLCIGKSWVFYKMLILLVKDIFYVLFGYNYFGFIKLILIYCVLGIWIVELWM